METIISLVALLGMGYGVFRGLKWMMKAGQAQSAKNAPLSPTDLKVLEESAARLMSDLRAVTDECVARIERACADAQLRIDSIERPAASGSSSAQPAIAWQTPAPSPSVIDAIETAATARESGMTTGEIELLRGLKAIESRG